MAKRQSTFSLGKKQTNNISNFFVGLQIKPQLVWLPGKCLFVRTT